MRVIKTTVVTANTQPLVVLPSIKVKNKKAATSLIAEAQGAIENYCKRKFAKEKLQTDIDTYCKDTPIICLRRPLINIESITALDDNYDPTNSLLTNIVHDDTKIILKPTAGYWPRYVRVYYTGGYDTPRPAMKDGAGKIIAPAIEGNIPQTLLQAMREQIRFYECGYETKESKLVANTKDIQPSYNYLGDRQADEVTDTYQRETNLLSRFVRDLLQEFRIQEI